MQRLNTQLSPEEHGLWWIAEIVMRHRKVMFALLAIGLLTSVSVALLTPSEFKASTVIAPASTFAASPQTGLASGLLGAAQRLGVAGNIGNDPSAMFPAFLKSESVSRRLLLRRFDGVGGEHSTLLDALVTRGDSSDVRLSVGRTLLARDVLKSNYSNKSGLTTISAYLPNAKLAAEVANFSVVLLDSAYTEARLRQAVAWAKFLEGQSINARQELETAENALVTFHQSNRNILASPMMTLEEARLQRRVALSQDVYASLMGQLAFSRAEANKEVPSIAVVDPAVAPMRRTRPERTRIVVTGLVLSFVLGTLTCVTLEYAKDFRRSPVAVALGLQGGRGRAS